VKEKGKEKFLTSHIFR